MDAIMGKGFRPSKCKALLKLTVSRMKNLRQKREVTAAQARRDVAQLLLQEGQEANALLRVEHVLKQQKTLEAYDLIQRYCNIVNDQMSLIHKNMTCPEGLKEAVSSLIFAANRVADLPELKQVRDLFLLKYGKEFVMAAADIHPDCAVSIEILEILCGTAASREVKIALMKDIAAEFNATWDSTKAQANLIQPSQVLLGGPSGFTSASQLKTLSVPHKEISRGKN